MALYLCSKCEYGSASWLGRCPQCNEWNSFTLKKEVGVSESRTNYDPALISPLSQVSSSVARNRVTTPLSEFDRVLGGGFVQGEVIFIAGEPGIGKSTLILQVISDKNALYVSGEESPQQVKQRAERLLIKTEKILFSGETMVERILRGVEVMKEKPQLLVIDSIQTLYSDLVDSPPGSVSQMKEVTNILVAYAKKHHLILLIIGHITKDGEIAGPKTLEHFVDCVLSFEGERSSSQRVLRSFKNRFGTTEEIGLFEMTEKGLQIKDMSIAFIQTENTHAIGRAIGGVNEGNRIMFYEVQVLAVPTPFSSPRRTVKGLDYNKFLLLVAITKKYLGHKLDLFDIYANLAGGVRCDSPLLDIALVSAIHSSVTGVPLSPHTVFSGEAGLLGEVRTASSEKKIIRDSKRLGFKKVITSSTLHSIKDLPRVIQSS